MISPILYLEVRISQDNNFFVRLEFIKKLSVLNLMGIVEVLSLIS